jgi:hypothetical protein
VILGWRGRGLLLPRGGIMTLLRLRLGDSNRGVSFAAHRSARSTLHPLPDYFSHWLINGTGVRLLLAHAQFGQHVDDSVRGDLKLPCQLIDSNFTHK